MCLWDVASEQLLTAHISKSTVFSPCGWRRAWEEKDGGLLGPKQAGGSLAQVPAGWLTGALLTICVCPWEMERCRCGDGPGAIHQCHSGGERMVCVTSKTNGQEVQPEKQQYLQNIYIQKKVQTQSMFLVRFQQNPERRFLILINECVYLKVPRSAPRLMLTWSSCSISGHMPDNNRATYHVTRPRDGLHLWSNLQVPESWRAKRRKQERPRLAIAPVCPPCVQRPRCLTSAAGDSGIQARALRDVDLHQLLSRRRVDSDRLHQLAICCSTPTTQTRFSRRAQPQCFS